MLKQSSNGMRKVLAVLLVGLFVVSLTAVAASADRHRSWWPWWSSWWSFWWSWW